MSEAIHAQCVSPCANTGYYQIASALQKQKDQLEAVNELIARDRMSRMTPRTMLAELADLQGRIDRARKAMKEGR